MTWCKFSDGTITCVYCYPLGTVEFVYLLVWKEDQISLYNCLHVLSLSTSLEHIEILLRIFCLNLTRIRIPGMRRGHTCLVVWIFVILCSIIPQFLGSMLVQFLSFLFFCVTYFLSYLLFLCIVYASKGPLVEAFLWFFGKTKYYTWMLILLHAGQESYVDQKHTLCLIFFSHFWRYYGKRIYSAFKIGKICREWKCKWIYCCDEWCDVIWKNCWILLSLFYLVSEDIFN